MSRTVKVVALVKENERYIFLFDSESEAEMLRTLGRFAGNEELSFSWYDAAVLSQKVRRLSEATEEPQSAGQLRAKRVPR